MKPMLFLIDGAYGYAKPAINWCVNELRGLNKKVTQIKKKSYRNSGQPKIDQLISPDITEINQDEFNRIDVITNEFQDRYIRYNFGEQSYFIEKKDIDEAIKNYNYIFLIVRGHDVAGTILSQYKDKADISLIYILTWERDISKYLADLGKDQEETDYYYKRHKSGIKQFKKISVLYRLIGLDFSNGMQSARNDLFEELTALCQLDYKSSVPDTGSALTKLVNNFLIPLYKYLLDNRLEFPPVRGASSQDRLPPPPSSQ